MRARIEKSRTESLERGDGPGKKEKEVGIEKRARKTGQVEKATGSEVD